MEDDGVIRVDLANAVLTSGDFYRPAPVNLLLCNWFSRFPVRVRAFLAAVRAHRLAQFLTRLPVSRGRFAGRASQTSSVRGRGPGPGMGGAPFQVLPVAGRISSPRPLRSAGPWLLCVQTSPALLCRFVESSPRLRSESLSLPWSHPTR